MIRMNFASLNQFMISTKERLPGLFVGSLLAISLVVLDGCEAIPSAGPNYKTPKTEVPPAFANGSQDNLSTNETAVTWGRSFNDAELNQLVDRAIAGNKDLQVASANIRQARALRREAQFDLGPVACAGTDCLAMSNSGEALATADPASGAVGSWTVTPASFLFNFSTMSCAESWVTLASARWEIRNRSRYSSTARRKRAGTRGRRKRRAAPRAASRSSWQRVPHRDVVAVASLADDSAHPRDCDCQSE